MQDRKINKVYILGLGAMGALYAAKFYDMNPDTVKIIMDHQRAKRSADVTVNGKPYSFDFLFPEDNHPAADLIIIAVKYLQLGQAIQDIKPFIGKDTIVISLLNGISSEQLIGKEIGMQHLLYAYGVGMDAVRQGTTINYTNPGRIVFGEQQNDVHSQRVIAVQDLFQRALIPHHIPADMQHALWSKFMLNTGINQVSALLRATYGIFQQNEEARKLMLMAAAEVVMLSKKCGVNLDQSNLDEFVKVINGLAPQGKTSMLQDIEAGRKTEVDIFGGTVIELGEQYQVATPVNQMLFSAIKVMEQMQNNDLS